MKIVQIATAVEHYKNGEVYTDLYGIDEEGNPHILVGNEWNLLTITTSEGGRGAEALVRNPQDKEEFTQAYGLNRNHLGFGLI